MRAGMPIVASGPCLTARSRNFGSGGRRLRRRPGGVSRRHGWRDVKQSGGPSKTRRSRKGRESADGSDTRCPSVTARLSSARSARMSASSSSRARRASWRTQRPSVRSILPRRRAKNTSGHSGGWARWTNWWRPGLPERHRNKPNAREAGGDRRSMSCALPGAMPNRGDAPNRASGRTILPARERRKVPEKSRACAD